MNKQLDFKQFSSVKIICLHSVQLSNRSIWPIDRTLSDATTSDQGGQGCDGNERVLHIPKSSSINETLPSDCLVPYPGYSFEES